MRSSPKTPAYIAYIDEAGDDGLNTVRPIDANGGCEWLMLSAVLIDVCREQETDAWLGDIHSVSNRDAECAKLLEPRMAREPDAMSGRLHGFGVKLMPAWGKARLLPSQQEIFRHYGYPNPQWWMPTKK